jgi:hypothetical protein
MKGWDAQIASRVIESFGNGVERSLVYKIVGGMDGIALSKGGNAVARVELLINGNDTKVLLSGYLSLLFAPESSRLRSVDWTILEDHFSEGRVVNRSSRVQGSSSQNLGSQLVHPSVVSLDADKTMDMDESHDPGMNI